MIKRFFSFFSVFFLLVSFSGVNGLQSRSGIEAPELTAADVNAWLDGFMPYALGTADVAGAVVTVVKDGEILVNRGFGVADIERNIPVDPANTLFRPGSISKLFTWTAVMQLVEQGKIDLDADVNNYLDFTIPSPKGTITMRHLMTHTPGFEEVLKDLFVEDAEFGEVDLRDFLVNHIPLQLFDAGTTPAYTNYATTLAGYIVQRVSGKNFETYVEDHVFLPLGMTRSSFRQPLPEALATSMSSGYETRSDGEPQPFEIVVPMPAGALSATGADIARFMIAHLDGGQGLMSPTTAHQMHETLDNQFPALNGFALGFYRMDRNGQKIVSHGGDTLWFHSDLYLFLDQNVGIYISMNSAGGERAGPIRRNFFTAFTDRYFPGRERRAVVRRTAADHGREMEGVYEASRGTDSSAIAIARYASQVEISMNDDNELIVPLVRDYAGETELMSEVEDWVWQSASGRRVAARVEDGHVVAISGEPALITYTPVPAYRSSAWLTPAMAGSVLILLATFFAWPIRAYARNKLLAPFPYEGRDEHVYRAAPIAAFLLLVYLVGWATFFTWIAGSVFNLEGARNETWLSLMYWAAALPLLATLLAAWSTFVKLVNWPGLFTKLFALVFLAACGVVVWFSYVVGFFSFNMQF